MKLLGGDRGLYKAVLAMAWPIMIEEGLQTAVSYVDTAVVGRLGAYASAAVGITQTPSWLLWGILRAAGIGLVAYVAQAMGAQDYSRTKRAGGQAILYSVIIGLVMTAVALPLAYKVPVWMGADPEIHKIAGDFFFIFCLPMLFRSLTVNLGAVIRATGDMRTPMLVNLLVNIINVALNLLLVYPSRQISLFGQPVNIWGAGMGVTGSATASAIAVTVGGLIMVAAIYRNQYISPRGMGFKPDMGVARFNIKIAIPAALQHIVICSGFMVFVSLVARLGTVSLAAHTIANSAEQAFFIPAMGLQGAAATMIGMAVGEGDEKKADGMAGALSKLAFATLAALGLLLFIFPGQLMSIFTTDPQVIAQGKAVLRIVAVAEPFFGVLTVSEGILRGVGNIKPSLYISLGCMWGIRVLFTWVCLSFFGMGLVAVWVCMSADNVSRFVCYTMLLKSGRWKRTVSFAGENPA